MSVRVLYFDTETTGLDADADVLEHALIDPTGAVILAGRCAPVRAQSWSDAERIHGISPDDVRGLPTWPEVLPHLIQCCAGADLVIYNAKYDLQYCPGLSDVCASVSCAMETYKRRIGARNWVKLTEAASAVGHDWPAGLRPHSALADTLATRSVWHWLADTAPERQP